MEKSLVFIRLPVKSQEKSDQDRSRQPLKKKTESDGFVIGSHHSESRWDGGLFKLFSPGLSNCYVLNYFVGSHF